MIFSPSSISIHWDASFHCGLDAARLPILNLRVDVEMLPRTYSQMVKHTRQQGDPKVTHPLRMGDRLLNSYPLQMGLEMSDSQCIFLPPTLVSINLMFHASPVVSLESTLGWPPKIGHSGGASNPDLRPHILAGTLPTREGSAWHFLSKGYLRLTATWEHLE